MCLRDHSLRGRRSKGKEKGSSSARCEERARGAIGEGGKD